MAEKILSAADAIRALDIINPIAKKANARKYNNKRKAFRLLKWYMPESVAKAAKALDKAGIAYSLHQAGWRSRAEYQYIGIRIPLDTMLKTTVPATVKRVDPLEAKFRAKYAALARSQIKDPDDLAKAIDASEKGELYFGGHYLPYDMMAEKIAMLIETAP